MAELSLQFQKITFAYDTATQPVIRNLSVHFTPGWTGIVGANGVGKSTILKLATGDLTCQQGRIIIPDFAIYCPQRTDDAPTQLQDLLDSMDGEAFEIKGRLGVEDDWIQRWITLSHGERTRAKQDFLRLKRATARQRDAASQANCKRSKRGLASGDHDARGKIDLARVTAKNGSAGKRLKQLDGRLSQAMVKMDGIKVKKTYRMGIWMPGAQSNRNTLFNLPAGALALGGDQWLHFPDLAMKPEDRIALTGPNGSGKSTLIRLIMQALNLEEDHVTYLPQEIDIRASREIMMRARNLPNEKLGQMMTVVSCLGSRPQRLLESLAPSPGEIRKILLATGIANVPHLIVMDEPTNHLDLPRLPLRTAACQP
jgi:ATPase subunit of ABC transporter with duplicated ATPase domains